MSTETTSGIQLPEGMLPGTPDIASDELVMIFINPSSDKALVAAYLRQIKLWAETAAITVTDLGEGRLLPKLDEELHRLRSLRSTAQLRQKPEFVIYRQPMRMTRMMYEADTAVHCHPAFEGIMLQTAKSKRYSSDAVRFFSARQACELDSVRAPKRPREMRMIRIDVSGYVRAGSTSIAVMIAKMLAERFPDRLVQLKNEGDAHTHLNPPPEADPPEIHAQRFMVVDMNNRDTLDADLFITDRDQPGMGEIINVNLGNR